MSEPDHLTLAQRFALVLGGVLRAVAALGGRDQAAVPLVVLAWTRVNKLRNRLAALLAKWEAGTLVAPRPRVPGARRERVSTEAPQAVLLPGRAGWLGQFVPEAQMYGSPLQFLLGDTELLALIAAAPQAGRVLRPLCRIMAVPLPEALRLPPRPARKPTRTAAAAKRKREAKVRKAKVGATRVHRPLALSGPSPGVVTRCRRSGKRRRRSDQ